MATAAEERNKALVLEAFDTLFKRRDYDAAHRFWSPDHIQHSAHIEPGREGLFELVKARRVAEACGLSPVAAALRPTGSRRSDEVDHPGRRDGQLF
jgi:hypothetical protein